MQRTIRCVSTLFGIHAVLLYVQKNKKTVGTNGVGTIGFVSVGATCSVTSSAGTRIPPVPARIEGAGHGVLLPENLAANTVDYISTCRMSLDWHAFIDSSQVIDICHGV